MHAGVAGGQTSIELPPINVSPYTCWLNTSDSGASTAAWAGNATTTVAVVISAVTTSIANPHGLRRIRCTVTIFVGKQDRNMINRLCEGLHSRKRASSGLRAVVAGDRPRPREDGDRYSPRAAIPCR